jgi:hypothetical protein
MSREKAIQDAIIALGQKLAASQLVCARSGNLSCRLGENIILITATGSDCWNVWNSTRRRSFSGRLVDATGIFGCTSAGAVGCFSAESGRATG